MSAERDYHKEIRAWINEAMLKIRPGDILPATDSRPECVVVPVEALKPFKQALAAIDHIKEG